MMMVMVMVVMVMVVVVMIIIHHAINCRGTILFAQIPPHKIASHSTNTA